MTTTLNASTSSGLVVTPDNSGQIAFQNNGTTELTVNAFGIGLGTAVPSSGTGITFPAVQDPSSNANTLDDYEEGTWTPTVERTGSSYTFNHRTGTYTKIGRQVTAQCYTNITAITTQGSGYITVTGLPFTCMNVSQSNFTGPIFYNTITATTAAMSVGVFTNSSFVYLKSTARNEDPINENTAVGYIMFTITYFTS